MSLVERLREAVAAASETAVEVEITDLIMAADRIEELEREVRRFIFGPDLDKADAWDAASVSWRKGYEKGRREALEEAATVVSNCRLFDYNDQLINSDPRQTCAAAIRKLMERE